MRNVCILAFCGLLPGCAVFSTECADERAALREADSAIAHAQSTGKGVFTGQFASRGMATYHCAPGRSGQVRCTQSASAAPSANVEELYRKRDAAALRVAQMCNG